MSSHGESDDDAGGPALPDPFTQADPWAQAANAARDLPPPSGVENPVRRSPEDGTAVGQGVSSNMAVTFPNTMEPPVQKFVHDVPPAWDGKDPDNILEP